MTPHAGLGAPGKRRAIEVVGAGEIAVWAGDTEGVCCFGELLAPGMKVRGCAGAVVDGGVRDSHRIAKHGFPVHARYRTPVASMQRWQVTGCGIPVFMRGAVSRWVAVHPGDLVLADADGVMVIPQDVIDAILPEAEQVTARETTGDSDLFARSREQIRVSHGARRDRSRRRYRRGADALRHLLNP